MYVITHHMSNPSVSNSCQFGFHRKLPPQGRFSSALPPAHGMLGCLSIPPTYHPYINESVWASENRRLILHWKCMIARHFIECIFVKNLQWKERQKFKTKGGFCRWKQSLFYSKNMIILQYLREPIRHVELLEVPWGHYYFHPDLQAMLLRD